MSELIAGAASGFLMASMFIGAGMLMLFSIVKNPSPAFQSIFQKFSPAGIAMSVVVLAYPTWGIIGAAMGLEVLTGLPRAVWAMVVAAGARPWPYATRAIHARLDAHARFAGARGWHISEPVASAETGMSAA